PQAAVAAVMAPMPPGPMGPVPGPSVGAEEIDPFNVSTELKTELSTTIAPPSLLAEIAPRSGVATAAVRVSTKASEMGSYRRNVPLLSTVTTELPSAGVIIMLRPWTVFVTPIPRSRLGNALRVRRLSCHTAPAAGAVPAVAGN